MPGSSKQLEYIFALIDGCKERGVTHFKDGEIAFSINPVAQLGDPFKDLITERPKTDASKCSKCQVAAKDPRYFGMCRSCGLQEAGVAS